MYGVRVCTASAVHVLVLVDLSDRVSHCYAVAARNVVNAACCLCAPIEAMALAYVLLVFCFTVPCSRVLKKNRGLTHHHHRPTTLSLQACRAEAHRVRAPRSARARA